MILNPINKISGEITPPADKSISHRSVMFGSLALGMTIIKNCLLSADCRSTILCMRALGVDIAVDEAGGNVCVNGKGLHGLNAANGVLDVGNSGTTTRLISGILSGQDFESTLSGDNSLNLRPMKRIITPLSQMGADIMSINGNDCAPLLIRPSKLHGITYHTPIASAQVKSSILLASLYADSKTTVIEPAVSRDHTERMLKAFGANVSHSGVSASIIPGNDLYALDISVPSDISSAAYFIAAALLSEGSGLLIKDVCINETRAGILKVIENMGGNISKENQREVSGEPVCDLYVKKSSLKATVIEGNIIPTLIDEIPIIAVLAATAEGTTIIKDASDLKAKESDRIASTCDMLNAMGAKAIATDDGMIIEGTEKLSGGEVDSRKDHRIAMSASIASLNASGETKIKDADCVDISYPSFYDDLKSICKP